MRLRSRVVVSVLLASGLVAVGCAAGCFADEPVLRETLTVPVAVEPAAADLDRSNGQQWHRVTLKLIGSLCPACLIGLENKLKAMPGVKFVKVVRPETPANERVRTTRNASATIIYDAAGVRFERLNEVIKLELYKATDVKDTEYTTP